MGRSDVALAMLVATLLSVVGLFGVAVLTQFTGYRLGGTITVPVLAVYTLHSALMLPVFLGSAVVAYAGLWYLRQRTLIYGRDELVAAFVMGTSIPLVVILLLVQLGFDPDVVVFFGSILPGLAAYNYHSVDPEYRRMDLLAGLGLLAVLVVLGWALVRPAIATRLGSVTPPVLFTDASDVAALNGATIAGETESVVVSREIVAAIFVAGLLLAERIRLRFGVRVGVVTAVLLAVYALTNVWLIVLYLCLFALAFGFVQAVTVATLRYGRVLLGVTVAFAVLFGVPLTVWLPIDRGLSALFVAFLAGVTAYNAHVTGPFERRLVLPLQAVVFVPALLVARLFGPPEPRGVPEALTPSVVLACVLVVAAGVAVGQWYAVEQPDESEVLSAGVLSEGEP